VPSRILVVCLLLGLGACAEADARLAARHAPPATPAPVAAPKPAEGLWAMLDPGCAKPQSADVHAWPHCASPFWISGDKALVILAAGHSATLDASYAADFRFTAGTPLIAQVGTEKDGYVFLALTDLTSDDRGRLVSAVGAAVACPKPTGGGVAVKPNANGCDQASPDVVRRAAAASLQDHTALAKVAWIASGAPSIAMLKTTD
jgi:hypothetical protein